MADIDLAILAALDAEPDGLTRMELVRTTQAPVRLVYDRCATLRRRGLITWHIRIKDAVVRRCAATKGEI